MIFIVIRRAFTGAASLAGAGLDRAFIQLAFRSAYAGRRGTRDSVVRRLDAAASQYAAARAELFPEPRAPKLVERWVRPLTGGEVVDVSWPSQYRAIHDNHRATLRRCPENRFCHARWFRHETPRSALICLHGWGAGSFRVEEFAYQVPWLFSRGMDVVIMNLPFHGRRRPRGRRTPMFPNPDPVRTNEGFAQAVLDIRSLVAYLRRHGAPRIGLTGMSLGGFTTSLTCTVEKELDFAVPVIPFASLPALIWRHARGTPALVKAKQAGLGPSRFAAAFAPTTPVKRTPTIASERVLIIAGERDRVTPVNHAHWLKRHFDGAELTTFPGAHIAQVGRRAIFKGLVEHMSRYGALPPSR